ncbi:MAG TPA: DUF3102 domain-containing protein [Spirochaetota bacterium]|nr:DUF3102 domain-containing protein [Spirochaetota bacterium]
MGDMVKVNNQQTGMSVERVEEMRGLYLDIKQAMETAYQKALRLGEMLSNVKGILPHGEFGSWIEENMNFSVRNAQRYMLVFDKKEELKDRSIESLSQAFKLLSNTTRSSFLESDKPQIENKIPKGFEGFLDVEFEEAKESDDEVIGKLYDKIEQIERSYSEQVKENARLRKEVEEANFIKKEKDNTIAAIRELKNVTNNQKEKFDREVDETLFIGKKIIEAKKYFQESIYLIQGTTLNHIACESMKPLVEPLLKVMNEWMEAVRKRYGIKE